MTFRVDTVLSNLLHTPRVQPAPTLCLLRTNRRIAGFFQVVRIRTVSARFVGSDCAMCAKFKLEVNPDEPNLSLDTRRTHHQKAGARQPGSVRSNTLLTVLFPSRLNPSIAVDLVHSTKIAYGVASANNRSFVPAVPGVAMSLRI